MNQVTVLESTSIGLLPPSVLTRLAQRELSMSAFRVWQRLYTVLLEHTVCRLSYRQLADTLTLSVKTVMRAVNVLCRFNLIQKQRMRAATANFLPNQYCLPDDTSVGEEASPTQT